MDDVNKVVSLVDTIVSVLIVETELLNFVTVEANVDEVGNVVADAVLLDKSVDDKVIVDAFIVFVVEIVVEGEEAVIDGEVDEA